MKDKKVEITKSSLIIFLNSCLFIFYIYHYREPVYTT